MHVHGWPFKGVILYSSESRRLVVIRNSEISRSLGVISTISTRGCMRAIRNFGCKVSTFHMVYLSSQLNSIIVVIFQGRKAAL